MPVSGTVGTDSPLEELTSSGMNGIKALERSRLPMPAKVSEDNSLLWLTLLLRSFYL